MDTSKAHDTRVNRERQDMNLVKLIEQFGSEDRCRSYLEHLRWPGGVRCINCGSDSISRIKTRNQLDCNGCRTRFSVTTGTVLHDTHLPLWKWFLATYLITESKKGVSANQIKRTLGVSYKTAWYLCHRIRWAMGDAPEAKLSGTVEVDETYVGGKRRGPMGWREKVMVMGAIERNGRVVLRAEGKVQADKERFHRFVKEVLAEDAEAVYTDQHWAYQGIGTEDTRHETVSHSQEEWVRGDVSTQSIESVWSLLDRSIIGSFNQLSAKHLPAYLDEISFRFNNRENPFLFRDTLRTLVRADSLTYADLTKEA